MKTDFFGQTDIGRKREKNEDSLLIMETVGLFIVADGMGGHQGGECASRLAVQTVGETLKQLIEDPDTTIAESSIFDRSDRGELLKYSIRQSSHQIFEEANRNPHLKGMGTTVVALLIEDHKGYIAHVGDSRAYLVRDHQIHQLTTDHSLVAEQFKAGFISANEVKKHKFKNIITRSVGFQSDVEVDLLVRDLREGDQFLLCSDGLTNMVDDDDIGKIVSKNLPKEACQKLIEMANKRGGDDNITVAIVSIASNG